MNFSQQINGYNKQEVDTYIERIKAGYESRLMEEKLKTLESERRLLNLRNEHMALEHKEQSILNAIDVLEKANKFQEEGTKSFYSLVIDKLQLLIQELNVRFPNLKKNEDFANILKEFTDVVTGYKDKFITETDITNPVNSSNDSMRILLNKMQDYKKGQESPKEVHISTIRTQLVAPQTTTDKFPENPFSKVSTMDQPKSAPSGFSFEEALNPKEDLSEIMKAFDFYNNDNNKSNR